MRFLCSSSSSYCVSPLASGLIIISQLDKVINDPAKPAGPGTDAQTQQKRESRSGSVRPVLDAEKGSLFFSFFFC